jgi:hypothetical protein
MCMLVNVYWNSILHPSQGYFFSVKFVAPYCTIWARSVHGEQHASLKGQSHEIFNFWFFSWISFPQAPEYTFRAVSNFFKNSRRNSQLKVDQRCHCHRWQICHRWRWYRWFTLTWEYLCEKIWNGPNWILWGWGGTDSWKKLEAKNLMTLSL